MTEIDLLIVGAGPVGLYGAYYAGVRGLSCAVVVATDVTPEELITWCRDGLAHFKAPRQVVFADDLPKTATGKLQRFKVRRLLASSPIG